MSHPTIDQLAAFSLGALDDENLSRIEQHVAECDACCERLSNVGSDTLVELARAATKYEQRTADAEVTRIVGLLADHPRYRIGGVLGAGGMGTVFRAEHLLMGRTVALKVINPRWLDYSNAATRFRQEFKAAACLHHPNIVHAYDAEQIGDQHVLVMEYVEGRSLVELVASDGPLGIDAACEYIQQAAAGLQHAHEQGMVHRDIKPHNMILTPDRTVKLLDFGLSRLARPHSDDDHHGTTELTGAGAWLGTPDYIAPEQASDPRKADIRSDTYSLGCTFYFLLRGRPPFDSGTAIEKLAAHLERQPPPVRLDVPPALADVLNRMLAKDPDDRFQTPEEVTVAIDRARQAHGVGAGYDGRRRLPFGLLCGGLLLALATVFYFNTDHGQLVVNVKQSGVEATLDGKPLEPAEPPKPVAVDKPEVIFQHADQCSHLHFIDDQLLLFGKWDLSYWDINGPARIKTIPFPSRPGRRGGVSVSTLSHDKKRLASATWTAPDEPFPIDIQDTETGEVLLSFGMEGEQRHTRYINGLSFSPDRKWLASCSRDGTARLWNAETGEHMQLLPSPYGPDIHQFDRIEFAHDGRRLVGVHKRYVVVWDMSSLPPQHRDLLVPMNMVYSIAVLPQGDKALLGGVVGGGSKGQLYLVDLTTGDATALPGDFVSVGDVDVSDDGQFALSGHADGSIRYWDLDRLKLLGEYAGFLADCHTVRFSAVGTLAACAGHARVVVLRIKEEKGRTQSHELKETTNTDANVGRFTGSRCGNIRGLP